MTKKITFAEFAELLEAVPEKLKAETSDALKIGGAEVVAVARAKLGHYQPTIGRWKSWAPLADETMRERVELGFPPNDPLLRSGELREDITYDVEAGNLHIGVPAGITHTDYRGGISEESSGQIARQLELGGSGPPRPFIAPALFQSAANIAKLLSKCIPIAFGVKR